jgi:hypothetical protein
MASVPIKPEYGPTLGRLLESRWRAASALARTVVRVLLAGLVVLAVGAFLTLENAHYSHGGDTAFGFSYRGLYRVAPAPGEFVRIERHGSGGRLEDSFAVRKLTLPPYTGTQTGELPLYAAGHIGELESRYRGFVLRGEGKTRVNQVAAYNIFFSAQVAGRTMWGRDVLLLPQRTRPRHGVELVMLTSPTANKQVTSPLEVASEGVLLKPVKTFSLG